MLQHCLTSREEAKLQRALDMGADHAIHSATRDVAKRAMALTGGHGVDVVVENVGAVVWSGAMKSLVRGGRLVTCGATSGDQPPADLRRNFIRQVQILGSTLGDLHEFGGLLSLVERSGMRLVIDADYRLEEAHAALDAWRRESSSARWPSPSNGFRARGTPQPGGAFQPRLPRGHAGDRQAGRSRQRRPSGFLTTRVRTAVPCPQIVTACGNFSFGNQ